MSASQQQDQDTAEKAMNVGVELEMQATVVRKLHLRSRQVHARIIKSDVPIALCDP